MNLKMKSLTWAISISVASLAMPSYALLISNSVTASININGVVTSDGPTDYAYVSDSDASGLGYSYKNFRAPGNMAMGIDNGYTQLHTEGVGYTDNVRNYKTSANVTHTATITNDQQFAQNVSFNFLIERGTISAGGSDAGLDVGYLADISLNGSSLWMSGAEVASQGDRFYEGARFYGTLTKTGVDLQLFQGAGPFNGYLWNRYNGSLNLGLLDVGASFTLTYSLNTYINEHFTNHGYSYIPYAEFNDPFNFNSSPLFAEDKFLVSPARNNPAPLPEPTGIALLGVGLAGLAFRRRAKKIA